MGSKVNRGKALGRNLVRLNGRLKRRIKWVAVGVSVLSAVGIGLLPAVGAELSAWRYDSGSRSLILTLPGTVVPNVSVTAPDQLLVELPDTQVGDVRAQRVNDGFVEEIFLEQATPETVWVVVDFVSGTVLSDTQQVAPLAASSNTLQMWKVQPTLMASRRAVDAAVAAQSGNGAGAAALTVERPSGQAIAQADFPDLPVLEPAVPLSQPVSVPPIDAAVPVRVPPVSSSAPSVEIPVQVEALPVVVEPAAPDLPAEVAASSSAPASAPPGPPFIGEIDVEVVETASPRPSEPIAFEDRSSAVEPQFDLPISDLPVSDMPTESVNAAGDSRWPEPIPFGQPLPQ